MKSGSPYSFTNEMKRLILLFAIILSTPIRAGNMGELQLKAEFVYRFAQYTGWEGKEIEHFHLCAVAESEQFAELEKLKERKLAGHAIEVLRAPDATQLDGCHILFVSAHGISAKDSVLSQYSRPHLLLVSDLPAALDERAVIAMVNEPDRIAFKINHSLAKKLGLYLNAQMLKLAKEVR